MRFIELFAGIGGFRYGLERVQFENEELHEPTTAIRDKKGQCKQQFNRSNQRLFNCVYANEIDKYACQIYRKNFGEGELYGGDIRNITTKAIPDHDLLVGGFPCQAFSIAGKRKGFNDTRGTLFFEICRIAKVKKPRLLLLENVKGLLNHEGGATFRTILLSLSELGYDCEWEVLNSKNFGVPQNRERVFIIGHLRGTGGGQVFPIGEGNGKYYDKQVQEFSRSYPRPRFHVSDSERTRRKIQSGLNIRRLTPTECERLQGFPDGWTEGLSDTQRYKCLGNAVTTNVIMEIGKRILENYE